MKTDFGRHLAAFAITGGEKAGAPMFEPRLFLGADAASRAVIADGRCDSRAIRTAVRACGAVPPAGKTMHRIVS